MKAWMANKARPAVVDALFDLGRGALLHGRHPGQELVKSTAGSARSKLPKARRAARQAELSQSATPDVAPAETTSELSAKVTEDKPSMSSQEARTRVAAALLARAFSDEQLKMVFNARIEDDGERGEFFVFGHAFASPPTDRQVAQDHAARRLFNETWRVQARPRCRGAAPIG